MNIKLKTNTFFLYGMIQSQSYDFNTFTAFF